MTGASEFEFRFWPRSIIEQYTTEQRSTMPGLRLADTVAQLSVDDDGWGPESVTSTTLDGVPYAPYSKGDKLGRMADWTQEGKEGAQRGNRNYNRNYRGK